MRLLAIGLFRACNFVKPEPAEVIEAFHGESFFGKGYLV